MKKLSLKLSVAIPAPPQKVFAALTEARRIATWSGQKGSVSSKVGGKFELFDGWVKGKVLEYKPPRSLVHTWLPSDWPAGTEESIVCYTLTASPKGTTVTLEHSNLPNATEKKSHTSGWKEFVLDPLKSHFTSRP